MPAKLLIPREEYLASGIHIGMKQRTAQMREFIYKIRPDGLAVLNLRKVDDRIRVAAKFLARARGFMVVSKKPVVDEAIKKFAEATGAKPVTGRVMPGILTNPDYKGFFEPDAIIVSDPFSDSQAVKESVNVRIPIVAICDTFNETRNVDLIIPANNKGKKAVATLFWILAREILKERNEIKSDKDFKYKVEDFYKEE